MEENSLASQSNTEIKFLQQVNECQQHLYCMEKLFLELNKSSENEVHLVKSNYSLNDISIKGCESDCSDKVSCKECKSSRLLNERSANIESSNKSPCSPLTFVIQVPNSLLNTIRDKISNNEDPNFLSQYPVKQFFRSKKRARIISSLQKIFRRKKSYVSSEGDQRLTQNLELLKFLKEKCEENISNHLQSSDFDNFKDRPETKNFTEKSSTSDYSTNAELSSAPSDLKNKQNFIFPITYNFNEKSKTSVKSTFTIHHEIMPQINSNECFNSVKIVNEMPTEDVKLDECSMKETQIKSTKERKVHHRSEMLLENLIKTLRNTIERLNDLETKNAFMEKLIKEESKQGKIKNFHQNYKDSKVKNSNFMPSNVSEKERKKQIAKILHKNDKQISKRQSSKLSICSSSYSISSDDEFNKNSKSNFIRKHTYATARCRSPSTFNYLVCQSERDIDQI